MFLQLWHNMIITTTLTFLVNSDLSQWKVCMCTCIITCVACMCVHKYYQHYYTPAHFINTFPTSHIHIQSFWTDVEIATVAITQCKWKVRDSHILGELSLSLSWIFASNTAPNIRTPFIILSLTLSTLSLIQQHTTVIDSQHLILISLILYSYSLEQYISKGTSILICSYVI